MLPEWAPRDLIGGLCMGVLFALRGRTLAALAPSHDGLFSMEVSAQSMRFFVATRRQVAHLIARALQVAYVPSLYEVVIMPTSALMPPVF
jgi:hypothetical protein